MAIKLERTTAGREKDGFSHESNDCVVRAIAIGFDVTYAEAHHLCKVVMDRKDNDGVLLYKWSTWMNSVTKNIIKDVVNSSCKTITIEKFIEKNPIGTFVCRISGHGFVIRDGVLIDAGSIRGGRRITHVWRTA